MGPDVPSFTFRVLVLVSTGVVLVAVLYAVPRVLELAPIGRLRREAWARISPIAAVLAALGYSIFAARLLFEEHPAVVPFMVAAVIGGFTLASWGALRDLASGALLRTGGLLEAGAHVRLDGVGGRIKRLGYRVMVLELGNGEEAVVPYASVARERIVRMPVIDGAAPHVFSLEIPTEKPLVAVRKAIRESALTMHWSAVSREPAVVAGEGGRLEVTVFAVHPDGGPSIEAAVRKAVERSLAS
jgi:hypothetical protein